jgi:hypothetical protein
MANEKVSKVIFGGQTLIDLTSDTVTADKLLSGYTAHGADGETITGSCDYDSDTSDDTAVAAEILASKTAHARGIALTGEMPNRGSVSGTISTIDGEYTIQNGYHDGSGKVGMDSTEQAKLIPSNVRQGVTVLGVVGTMSGQEDVHAQAKNVTPSVSAQTLLPDTGYNFLSQVNVAAIPYTEALNAAGGLTATIAGA